MPDTNTPRTDPSVQAFQHNARLQAAEADSVFLAAAGLTQGSAAQIGTSEIIMTSVTTSSQGVKLPVWATGLIRKVIAMSNKGVKVYPNTGDRLTGAATNAAVSVPLNRVYTFYADRVSRLWRIERGAAS